MNLTFIRFEMAADEVDTDTRIIEGAAIPYGTTAKIEGGVFEFAPGSTTPGTERVPVVLSHDMANPVGIVEAWTETDSALRARVKVDATPAGDSALVQAASGSRAAFSIGAEVVESFTQPGNANEGEPEVTIITAAIARELSLVVAPAFAGASVDRVAASQTPNQETKEMSDDQTPEPVEASPEPAAAAVEVPTALPSVQVKAAPELSLAEFAWHTTRALHGDDSSAATIRAAFVPTLTDPQAIGVLPESYVRELIDTVTISTVLKDTVTSAALPDEGKTFSFPVQNPYNVPDNRAWDAASDDLGPSWSLMTAEVQPWSNGTEIHVDVLERAAVDAMGEIMTMLANSYAQHREVKIATAISALAFDATAGADLSESIANALLEVQANNYGQHPSRILLTPATAAALVGAQGTALYHSGSLEGITAPGQIGSVMGVPVFVSHFVDAGYVVCRAGLTHRQSSQVTLRAARPDSLTEQVSITLYEGLNSNYHQVDPNTGDLLMDNSAVIARIAGTAVTP